MQPAHIDIDIGKNFGYGSNFTYVGVTGMKNIEPSLIVFDKQIYQVGGIRVGDYIAASFLKSGVYLNRQIIGDCSLNDLVHQVVLKRLSLLPGESFTQMVKDAIKENFCLVFGDFFVF